MLIGNIANSLASGGGFCAGSHVAVDHQVCGPFLPTSFHSHYLHPSNQRINGTAFVYSASLPGLLATSASEGINILRNTPSLLATLQDNVRAVRAVLDKLDLITIPSHPASPLIHIHVRPPTASSLAVPAAHQGGSHHSSPASIVARDAPVFDIAGEERLLQEVVEEALAQGVLVTRAKRLRGQEMVEARPSIRIAVTAALTRKECEKAASVVKAALVKVLGRKR